MVTRQPLVYGQGPLAVICAPWRGVVLEDEDGVQTVDVSLSAAGAPALLHIAGYLTGTSLFTMLLVMAIRGRGPAYHLTLMTSLLGIGWNVGELLAHVFSSLQWAGARDWLSATAYASLGFLAAVVVHSADRAARIGTAPPARRRLAPSIGALACVCAGIAGSLHLLTAAHGAAPPSTSGLILLTCGLTLLSVAVLVVAGRRAMNRRATWMIPLAWFAVSALHIGRFHGASESWMAELLGHHASIPLAFAILYQDYRFAFADIFLKRALALMSLVAIVFVAWLLLRLSQPTSTIVSLGLQLTLWVGTALIFPHLQRSTSAFVDRVLLKRSNYARLIEEVSSTLQACESEDEVLSFVATTVCVALGDAAVTWRPDDAPGGAESIPILTAERPHHALAISRLHGGRRLLSDDVIMLDRVALLAGRRIDALRLSEERYERMVREDQMRALATEAELRALRAQINPHFLFNALTTLGYLIQHAPARAFETLMRLTTLLRAVLRSEGEFATLGHERQLIECYLDIERERFEERLDASIDMPHQLDHLQVPALIIQPLVENAIKHGIAPARRGGRVHVASKMLVTDGVARLSIRVTNTGVTLGANPTNPGAGIGLENVRRRLRSCYGEAATFTLERAVDTNETVATLVVPAPACEIDQAPTLGHQGGQ